MTAQLAETPVGFDLNQPFYRVIVTGSRDWLEAPSVWRPLDALLQHYGRIAVVHGLCPDGADAHAETWLQRNAGPRVRPGRFPADWPRYKGRAGFIRNGVMVRSGADLVLAFANPCSRRRPWCPPGKHPSHGTADCVAQAREAGIPIKFSPEGMSW
ncbi:hypothetical protein SEA_SATIS_113 [Streptomyces phage Satis]|nr:hypothetical protein SEA_SATIS_113 [Streptomyces phage Satis]QBZ72011.1 DprA-like DNA processing chain A [Streptomyces phage Kradal]QPL14431.1 DprA-like DNA processing chain A [Streptomyces phage EhyElimayoE]